MISKQNNILLKGFQVYTNGTIIDNGYIKIKNQKVVEVGKTEERTIEEAIDLVEFPSNFKAIPGFIDVHIHGVNGVDTMDGTKEALEIMTEALPKEGTTSFLVTTMTQERESIEKALINAGEFITKQRSHGKAEILGIHLEGPFVNSKMAGAQPIQYIIDPDLSLFKKWQVLSNGNIKLVTLAPERPGGLELIRYLKENGIIASIGHTDATYADVNEAIVAGASHVTHLYNQMRGLHHREPGVVGTAFLRDELKAEIIVDGLHVCPEMVQLAFKQKRSEGLLLITDSMRAKCMKNGKYDLGGQEVFVTNGKAVLENGTLAGSTLKMGCAVKNMLTFTECTLNEAIEMASVNPAKELKIYDCKGSIAQGKDADIVILDDHLEVFMTFCRGALAFKK
ncbi:N-acetylglucosamine-6-phosphate deacetylase [Neobacillus vireti]|uniref:N-acetylglucosamine-6-phosphate deacetylase n=1 Tax=Neobacillus vireti TaxID=220686 RepID=UPI002FFDC85A